MLNLSELADFEYAYYKKIDYLNKSLQLNRKISNRPNTQLLSSIYSLASAYGHPVSNYAKVHELLNEALSYKNLFNAFNSDSFGRYGSSMKKCVKFFQKSNGSSKEVKS